MAVVVGGLLAVALVPSIAAGAARRHHHGPSGLAQPTAQHPLTVLVVGDSLGIDLGVGLREVLGTDARVHLLQKAVVDSGLANTAFYDWPTELERELHAFEPALVVVLIGANDAVGFDVGDRAASFGSAFWRKAYGQRVAEMMSEATAANAKVLWVGPPVMASARLSAAMLQLNAVYGAEASTHPAVRYLSTWKLFENPSGKYSAELPGPNGALVRVRQPDGVHITAPYGTDRLARAVVSAIEADWSVRI